MRNLFAIIMATLIFAPVATWAQNDDAELLVTMPVPPKTVERLDERCNYIVDNYWKTFNPKASFSNLKRLDATFGQFVAFTPYATADTVHAAISTLLKNVAAAKPENLVTLASIAEKWCYADSAEYQSEELYFPFVEAVATNKKAKGALRPRFEAQYRQLRDSRVGCKVQNLTLQRPDGTYTGIDSISAPLMLLFFYDPDCTDCRLAKARLAADFTIGALIRNNTLAIVAIYPGEPGDEWRNDALTLPKDWVVGALPDADLHFTMRNQPEIYYLDPDRIIRVKDVPVDNILTTFRQQFTRGD